MGGEQQTQGRTLQAANGRSVGFHHHARYRGDCAGRYGLASIVYLHKAETAGSVLPLLTLKKAQVGNIDVVLQADGQQVTAAFSRYFFIIDEQTDHSTNPVQVVGEAPGLWIAGARFGGDTLHTASY